MIRDLQNLSVRLNNLEFCFDTLLKLKKDEDKFVKFAQKRIKERTEEESRKPLKDGTKGSKLDK